MVTQAPNASVSFSFYGTGVQIYGAKRVNHGPYQVQIDSTVYPQVSGKASNPEIFQTALFSTVALNNGFHNVTMKNVGSGNTALDIDFVCLFSKNCVDKLLDLDARFFIALMADAHRTIQRTFGIADNPRFRSFV